MTNEKRPPYGTAIAKPDRKAGVEVGGGEKPAAMPRDGDARSEPKPGSQSDSEHERRPEGPHDPDQADEIGKPR